MPHRLTLPAVLAALLLLPASVADAGKGFVSTRPLHRTNASFGTEARGGFSAWFRMRHDHTYVQGLRVWFDGVEAAEGATLWMSKPGDAELAEVGAFSVYTHDEGAGENSSGMFEVVIDSAREENPEIPAGAESMLRLFGAPIEVRVAAGIEDVEDIAVLAGTVGNFRFRSLKVDAAGMPGRRVRLVRPPEPTIPVDEEAVGLASLWRRRSREVKGEIDEGILLFARGLEADTTYEVLVEDPSGDMVVSGEFESSAEGLGFFSIDSREGDLLPAALEADDIRDLRRRRVEVRRAGFSDYSLAGLFR